MKRRYWYNPVTKEVEEVTSTPEPVARLEISTDSHYEGARGIDGSDISTRRRHKEHMEQHGLALADDFTNHWKEKAAERARFKGIDPESGKFTGTSGWDREQRRADVAAALRRRGRK